MAEFFSFLKILVASGTIFFITTIVLLALPKSRLRSVGLEMTKWAAAGCLLLLTVSPVDVIPDVIPGLGWCDDFGYVVGAFLAARSAWGEHKRRAFLPE